MNAVINRNVLLVLSILILVTTSTAFANITVNNHCNEKITVQAICNSGDCKFIRTKTIKKGGVGHIKTKSGYYYTVSGIGGLDACENVHHDGEVNMRIHNLICACTKADK